MVRALPSTREQAQLAAHAPQPGATVLAAGVLGTVAASSLWAPLLALAEDIDTQAVRDVSCRLRYYHWKIQSQAFAACAAHPFERQIVNL